MASQFLRTFEKERSEFRSYERDKKKQDTKRLLI